MARIFISHSSVNNAAALAVAKWLADSGWDDYFLDVSPRRGLAPGERWQEALKAAADRCEAVLFLISPAWRDSRWCLAEFLLAKQLGKTIFGVLVEPTPLDTLPAEMTAEWQVCDLATGAARKKFRVSHDPLVSETEVSFARDGLERLKEGLQKAGLDASTFPWPPPGDPERSPYRGLKALEAEDAAVFFGRDAAIVRGLDALRGLRERGVERMLVLLGASGAGKSSFLRAGLWPRLARDDRHFLPLAVIRPERAAISGATGLAASVEKAFREAASARTRADIRKQLEQPGGLDRLLVELLALRPAVGPDEPKPTVVMAIDQGEELLLEEGRSEAEILLARLAETLAPPEGEGAEAIAARRRALVVVAIRSDSYERLQTEPKLAGVKPALFSLPPIERAEFKSAVEGPANRATAAGRKLEIDPCLTERLLQDAQGADARPLLAFTLERLFIEHGGDGDLTLSEYEDLGGVRGSIEAAITAAFADPGRAPAIPTDPGERERCLRLGFIPWLASVDPETEERKRRVARWEEIPVEARPVLERLVEARLLQRDRRRTAGVDEETTVVEIAHEALLRQWPTLSSWLDEDADRLKALGSVQRAATEWNKNKQGVAWLVHTGERLEAAEELQRRPEFVRLLGADGQVYLRACRDRDNAVRKEADEARQRELNLEREHIRLSARMKLRIAPRLGYHSSPPWVIKEDWYKIATDHTRSIVLVRGSGLLFTGFAVQGSALFSGWSSRPVVVTASHLVRGTAERIDPSEYTGHLPGVDDKQLVEFDKVLWSSPVEAFDTAVLQIKGDLPFGAIPVSHLARQDLSSLPIADPDAPSGLQSRGSLMILGFIGVGDASEQGFQIAITQLLGRAVPSSGASAAVGLVYTYATGGGASGAPVFDADTGELVGVHVRRRPPGKAGLPDLAEGIWLGNLAQAIAED